MPHPNRTGAGIYLNVRSKPPQSLFFLLLVSTTRTHLEPTGRRLALCHCSLLGGESPPGGQALLEEGGNEDLGPAHCSILMSPSEQLPFAAPAGGDPCRWGRRARRQPVSTFGKASGLGWKSGVSPRGGFGGM